MKKMMMLAVALLALAFRVGAQDCYWVFLADKQGTTFDPYTYFDAKAIERYRINGADLCHQSNYPLNEGYVSQVDAIATEEVGTSRWLNAIGVMATPEQADRISNLPFVLRVQKIESVAALASYAKVEEADYTKTTLSDQLSRQQGELFQKAGINGKGVRVAVFDGGFPKVNTHAAFKHLRDNGQIIKTWNFCNRKEDVYGWSSHGTMTLSCIAGIRKGVQIGLAPAAEYLLARTEVDAEPFKEEVWWMQAMEWADKNGAQVISSSLGYGKERHYTKDMDGTSYVAKAANMAVRKGMVVCNSAGNEGDDSKWYTIITPADADSVICVGGIENSLTSYRHINFSSYGPTADGRQKPDVVNFGYAEVASPSNDSAFTMAYGTSFSCPLTSGFVACAIQAHPGKTAMEIRKEIIESSDLYPYHDYAFGYGVPQASYFTGDKYVAKRSFEIVDSADGIMIRPLEPSLPCRLVQNEGHPLAEKSSTKAESLCHPMFVSAEYLNGRIERYISLEIADPVTNRYVYIPKSSLVNRQLNVSYNGYYESFRLSEEDNDRLLKASDITEFFVSTLNKDGEDEYDWATDEVLNRTPSDNYVDEHKSRVSCYFQFGDMIRTSSEELDTRWWCPSFSIGLRSTKPIAKWYALGTGFDLHYADFNQDPTRTSAAEYLFGNISSQPGFKAQSKTISTCTANLELFQRIRLVPTGGVIAGGVWWDLGVFGGYKVYYQSRLKGTAPHADGSANTNYNLSANFTHNDLPRWTFGATTRITYKAIGLYARYDLTQLIDRPQLLNVTQNPILQLPALEVGLQFAW